MSRGHVCSQWIWAGLLFCVLARAEESVPEVQILNPYLSVEQVRGDMSPDAQVQLADSAQDRLLEMDWLKPHLGALDAVDRDLLLIRAKQLSHKVLQQRYPSVPPEVLAKLQKQCGANQP